jgi:hypothetical protein
MSRIFENLKKAKDRVSPPKAAQTTEEHSLPGDGTFRRLRCLNKGGATVFTVEVAGNKDINDLRELIREKGKNSIFATVDALQLVLLKVSDILESSFNTVTHLRCFVRLMYVSLARTVILLDDSPSMQTRKEFKR